MPQTLNPDTRVIIRIWLPKIEDQATNAFKVVRAIKKGRDANIGHASIETPSSYASIWPHPDAAVTGAFDLYKHSYHTLVEDELAESGPADVLICLYSLNSQKIEAAFDRVRQNGKGYVLTGDNSIAGPDGESCCTLAYKLLEEGGINRLKANQDPIMQSVVITPDNLAAFVKNAKNKELQKYPETKGENFKYYGTKKETATTLEIAATPFWKKPTFIAGGSAAVLLGALAMKSIRQQETLKCTII